MKKAITIHILGTFIYLACFLYISDGITLDPLKRATNVLFLALVNFSIACYCDINDLYKNK